MEEFVVLNGALVSVASGEVLDVPIWVKNGRVAGFKEKSGIPTFDARGGYVCPGFVDPHVHVESSLLTPERFAEACLPHGTTCVVTDLHEVANVLGKKGVLLMVENSKKAPMRFFFTVPSCVPPFPDLETSGGTISMNDIEDLLQREEFVALGEFMDIPSLLRRDEEALKKIRLAFEAGKPVDGHAPSLSPEEMDAYFSSGPSSDHEIVEGGECLEKLRRGVWCMLRLGSLSQDLVRILPKLLEAGASFQRVCFCADDIHVCDLLRKGYLDRAARTAIELGMDPLEAIACITLRPASRFGLEARLGVIAPGRYADLVILEDLEGVKVRDVFVGGELVVKRGKLLRPPPRISWPEWSTKTVKIPDLDPSSFLVPCPSDEAEVLVIGVREGSLLTDKLTAKLPCEGGYVAPSTDEDVLLAAVVERHGKKGTIGKGFVKGFGLRKGAIASTVAHDSHNMVLVGADSKAMLLCAKALEECSGGLAVSDGSACHVLPLPVAGLMSYGDPASVCDKYERLLERARALGCTLSEPFMALSFISLSAIPSLRITDRGLVDVEKGAIVRPIIGEATP